MNKRGKRERLLSGSMTVEAAWVMAAVFLAIAVVIQKANRIHDETTGRMILHEAVEKARHERGEDLAELGERAGRYMGLLLSFPSYEVFLEERGAVTEGRCRGGAWSYEIQAEGFRPETFLRKVTLLERAGEED